MKKIKIKIATKDKRGNISDIFYKNNIEHVSIINSKKGALRGDHYHKETTQAMYMTKGNLRYYYQKINLAGKRIGKVSSIVIKESEVVTTPPYEIHSLEILEDNQFIVFSWGKRGGKDYESDTFRVKPSLIPQTKWKKWEQKSH